MSDQQNLPRPTVRGPSAWYGADLARRPEEWTYHFTAADLAEIDAATRSCRGRDIASITGSDFPLPEFGPVLLRIRDDLLNRRGFVLLLVYPSRKDP